MINDYLVCIWKFITDLKLHVLVIVYYPTVVLPKLSRYLYVFHDYDLMYLVAIYGSYVFGMDLWISMNYGCLVSFL